MRRLYKKLVEYGSALSIILTQTRQNQMRVCLVVYKKLVEYGSSLAEILRTRTQSCLVVYKKFVEYGWIWCRCMLLRASLFDPHVCPVLVGRVASICSESNRHLFKRPLFSAAERIQPKGRLVVASTRVGCRTW